MHTAWQEQDVAPDLRGCRSGC